MLITHKNIILESIGKTDDDSKKVAYMTTEVKVDDLKKGLKVSEENGNLSHEYLEMYSDNVGSILVFEPSEEGWKISSVQGIYIENGIVYLGDDDYVEQPIVTLYYDDSEHRSLEMKIYHSDLISAKVGDVFKPDNLLSYEELQIVAIKEFPHTLRFICRVSQIESSSMVRNHKTITKTDCLESQTIVLTIVK